MDFINCSDMPNNRSPILMSLFTGYSKEASKCIVMGTSIILFIFISISIYLILQLRTRHTVRHTPAPQDPFDGIETCESEELSQEIRESRRSLQILRRTHICFATRSSEKHVVSLGSPHGADQYIASHVNSCLSFFSSKI